MAHTSHLWLTDWICLNSLRGSSCKPVNLEYFAVKKFKNVNNVQTCNSHQLSFSFICNWPQFADWTDYNTIAEIITLDSRSQPGECRHELHDSVRSGLPIVSYERRPTVANYRLTSSREQQWTELPVGSVQPVRLSFAFVFHDGFLFLHRCAGAREEARDDRILR